MNRRDFFGHLLTGTTTIASTGVLGTIAWTAGGGEIVEDWTQRAYPEIIADCSSDPFDVRPLTTAIMESANFILERLPADVPLVIIMGEAHNIPSHSIARAHLLKTLKSQFETNTNLRFAYGIEDHLSRIDREFFAKSPLSEAKIRISGNINGFGLALAAPLTSQAMAKFLYEEAIETQLNDIRAERNPDIFGTVIDQKDPETKNFVVKHAPEFVDKRIIRSSDFGYDNRLGLMLSNRMMVKKVTQHIKNTQSKIYVQHCGLTHTFGDRQLANLLGSAIPYNESLTYYFREAGYGVLTVMPDFTHIPYASIETMDNTVLAEGLDQTKVNNTNEAVLLERLQRISGFKLHA